MPARPRGFLVLFGASLLLALANALRQLLEQNSRIDVPLGLLSLAVALASATALWGCARGAAWAYRAIVGWAGTVWGAAVVGAVLMRPYMPRLQDTAEGPAILTVLLLVVVWRARRRFGATMPAGSDGSS